MNYSNILGAIWKELKIRTQEEFVCDLYISFSTLNRWESSYTFPSKLAKMRLFEYCSKQNVSNAIIVELVDA